LPVLVDFRPDGDIGDMSDDTTLSRSKSAARETTSGTLWTRLRPTEQTARLVGNMTVSAASEFSVLEDEPRSAAEEVSCSGAFPTNIFYCDA
jgi:hypothetical protein